MVLPKSMALCLLGLRVYVLESSQVCDSIEEVQNAVLFGTWCRRDRRHSVTGTLRLSAGLLNRSTNGPPSALCRKRCEMGGGGAQVRGLVHVYIPIPIPKQKKRGGGRGEGGSNPRWVSLVGASMYKYI